MNKNITLFASANRTATTASGTFVNDSAAGCHIVIDVTVATGTTPTLAIAIEAFDPASSKWYTVLQSASLVAAGTTVLRIGRGLTAAANLVASDVLPRIFRANAIIGGTAPTFTFSVGASTVL